jgi:hypothetical protein
MSAATEASTNVIDASCTRMNQGSLGLVRTDARRSDAPVEIAGAFGNFSMCKNVAVVVRRLAAVPIGCVPARACVAHRR